MSCKKKEMRKNQYRHKKVLIEKYLHEIQKFRFSGLCTLHNFMGLAEKSLIVVFFTAKYIWNSL